MLTRYAVVPGVQLTGKLKVSGTTLPFTFTGTIRVSGPKAAAGMLRVTSRSLSGTLDGRQVSRGL